MEFQITSAEKRYCAGQEELLRTIVSMPTGFEGEEMRELFRFLTELAERSFAFSENILFPSIRAEYEALSPRDKKFAVPRRVYRVTVTVKRTKDAEYGEALRTELLVALRKRGRNEFETCVARSWVKSRRSGVYQMVIESRIGGKLKKNT